MLYRKFPHPIIVMTLALLLFAGCVAPTLTPTLPSAISPQPPINSSPQIPGQTVEKPNLFKFVRTVQVTPDDQYLTGAFARINYLSATDRFVVTFGGLTAQPSGCTDKGFHFKIYAIDMQATGESGTFACDRADAGSVMVDNMYYYAAMANESGQVGWHLLKIDATNWETLIDEFYALDYPSEGDADPMVAFVNGQLDISSAYSASGTPPNLETPAGSYGSHHHFFSTDLQLQGKKTLTEPPHINGSYMVYVDGVYYLVTSNLYDGDILVAKYDTDWNYLGGKTLIEQAHFSTGLVYDGQRFYLAYTDTSQRTDPGFFPVTLNIHLAAFDRDWNLLQDVAVTSYAPQDGMQPGRPWVIRHDNWLYVSYDVDTTDPVTREEHLQWQAYVSIYELTGIP